MPIFEIQDAGGKTYEVDAPDIMTAAKAFKGYAPQAASTTEDVAKSAGSGIASGATKLAGLIPDLSSMAHGAANKYLFDPLFNAVTGPPKETAPDQQPPDINRLAGSENIQKGVESLTGKFYEPQTTAGKYAHSIGEAIPGSLAAPGSGVAKLLSGVGAGIGGEFLGEATDGTKFEPYARMAGSLAGGLAPTALGHVITPIPANVARQRLVDTLRDEGVTSLTAGQRTGSRALQNMETIGDAPMAGAGNSRIMSEGQRQFTEAAMRRAGDGLLDASPEVLATNNARLGGEFRTLSARNTMTPDNQFITDIAGAVRNYRNVPQSQQREMLQGYIDDIVPHVNAGAMSGVEYQALRSRLSRQANNNRQSDPDLSEALRGIRNALDNAMERSLAGTPDAGAWLQARQNQAGNIDANYQRFVGQTNPLASNTNFDPYSTPGFRDAVDTMRNDITNQVNGSFAAAGRDFSGANFNALGRGISSGIAPTIANQFNQNVQNQQSAAGNLFNAGNTNAGLLSGLQQQSLANKSAGVGSIGSGLEASNAAATSTLAAEAQRLGIPMQNLGLLANIGIPIAGLGGQSSGTSTTTQKMSPMQQMMGFSSLLGNFGAGRAFPSIF